MTQLYLHHASDDIPCRCENCDSVTPSGQLDMITDFEERVSPGEVVPAGQCPSCGALAHYEPRHVDRTLPLPAYLPEVDVLQKLIDAAKDCRDDSIESACGRFIAAAEKEIRDRGGKAVLGPGSAT